MNTQVKHTPGPWGLDAMQADGFIPVRGGVGEVVALINMSEANAALIAAAPAMYEALSTLAELLDERGLYPLNVDDARRALAQAEGR